MSQIDLGKIIRASRESQGRSLVQTAKDAGYTPQYLSRVECGHCTPSEDMVINLVSVLNDPQLRVSYWQMRVKEIKGEYDAAKEALKSAREATRA